MDGLSGTAKQEKKVKVMEVTHGKLVQLFGFSLPISWKIMGNVANMREPFSFDFHRSCLSI